MSTLYTFCQQSFVILFAISFIGYIMNQTQKRLSIIKLAISITDIETIQLQVLKLTPLKTDAKVQEILVLLQEGNYAQAQALITTYIDSEPEEILQRTSQHTKPSITPEEQAIIDEFGLFITPSNQDNKTVEIDINDYTSVEAKITKEKHAVDYASLLELEADDILSNNIDIDISQTYDEPTIKDSFFDESVEVTTPDIEPTFLPKDSFFDEDSLEEETKEKTIEMQSTPEIDTEVQKDEVQESEKDIFSTPIIEESGTISYEAMPHISQKLISMKKRYPLIQTSYEQYETVESLLTKIAQEGYTESEIEEMIIYIQKLIKKTNYTEAGQLLLVCGATESKFAQFMLARELYKGSILIKNITEAFTLMNTLAIDDYPEALCDLGQFYENGIGTTSDLMKAEGLYKEAVNLNIKRAKKHYIRLKKHNRGFLKG